MEYIERLPLTDAISLTSEIDKNNDTTLVATYANGNLTAIVAKTDDGITDASLSLDYGNADLTIGRVGERAVSHSLIGRKLAKKYSHLTYKVSF
tara:strand:- start:402 stop:683 length:282 start_codon:yes stop_codon:yes gene_type:complete